MFVSRRTIVRWITFGLVAALLTGWFFIKEHSEKVFYKTASQNSAGHAFAELTGSMESLSSALMKASRSSGGSLSAVAIEAYGSALAAQAALGAIPWNSAELEHTAAFITKAGDYSAYLARAAAHGAEYGDEGRANMLSLANSARRIADMLTNMSSGLLSGEMSVERISDGGSELGAGEDSMVDTSLASGFKELETEFPEMPTLIYDGPFSEHIMSRTPRLLENKKEIGEDRVKYIAAEFTGLERTAFSLDGTRGTDVPVYLLSAHSRANDITLEITKVGGFVLYYGSNRNVGMANYSTDDAVKYAKRFLNARGIEGMTETYTEIADNICTINFAYSDSGVIYYPDLIKIAVALDTGEVVGFESLGYVMSHGRRESAEAAVTADEAAQTAVSGLTVLDKRLAVIPTSGKNEVLTWELKCEDTEGQHCLIYVNAATGVEEKILLLIESESATLAI